MIALNLIEWIAWALLVPTFFLLLGEWIIRIKRKHYHHQQQKQYDYCRICAQYKKKSNFTKKQSFCLTCTSNKK